MHGMQNHYYQYAVYAQELQQQQQQHHYPQEMPTFY